MSDYESRDYDDRGGRGSRGTRVYVGGLDGGIKKEDLEFEFEKFGKLNSVWVAYNPPGFAFVEFAERRDAEAACDSMNNAEMMGAQLRVEISRGRGRGRGGGRGGRGGFGDRDGFSRSGGGFGDRDGGRGGFRGGRGGPGGRGRGRGGGFRGRGGFDDGFRSSSRDEGYRSRDGAPGGGRSYTSNGYPPRDSAPRVSRFRSRSPHRSSSRGGSGSAGRRDYSADSYGGRPSGGYQRNSYQGSAPY